MKKYIISLTILLILFIISNIGFNIAVTLILKEYSSGEFFAEYFYQHLSTYYIFLLNIENLVKGIISALFVIILLLGLSREVRKQKLLPKLFNKIIKILYFVSMGLISVLMITTIFYTNIILFNIMLVFAVICMIIVVLSTLVNIYDNKSNAINTTFRTILLCFGTTVATFCLISSSINTRVNETVKCYYDYLGGNVSSQNSSYECVEYVFKSNGILPFTNSFAKHFFDNKVYELSFDDEITKVYSYVLYNPHVKSYPANFYQYGNNAFNQSLLVITVILGFVVAFSKDKKFTKEPISELEELESKLQNAISPKPQIAEKDLNLIMDMKIKLKSSLDSGVISQENYELLMSELEVICNG